MAGDDATTRKLIRRAKRGDNAAISALYSQYVDRIFRYIRYRVPSESDAEDLTTEVIVIMLERLPTYTITGAPFEAWLYRIAANRVAEFYRQRERHPIMELSEQLVGALPLPEETLLEQQELDALHAALNQLSETEQTVLILRFVERKSHQAVAELLNKELSAVKTIQYRALIRLARLLGIEKQTGFYLRGDDES